MNLEFNSLNILILSIVLVFSYLPVNRAVDKNFNQFGMMYLMTFGFRLSAIVIAFKVYENIMDVALSILIMMMGEVLFAIKISNKSKLVKIEV